MFSAATPAQSTLSFMCVWPPTSCHMVSNNSLSLSLARSLTNNRTSLSDSCSLIALCNLPLTTVSLSLSPSFSHSLSKTDHLWGKREGNIKCVCVCVCAQQCHWEKGSFVFKTFYFFFKGFCGVQTISVFWLVACFNTLISLSLGWVHTCSYTDGWMVVFLVTICRQYVFTVSVSRPVGLRPELNKKILHGFPLNLDGG